MLRLANKVAFITGGAKGIGFACAQALGLEGSKVVLGDVSKDDLDQAKNSLAGDGIVCETVLCDVGDRAQVEAAVNKAVQAFGQVDIAVANAGIVRSADFLEMTDEDWDAVIRVNLKGVFLTGQVVARQMKKQGNGGSIINISSVNGILAIPTIANYNASKGGINNLTRSMSLALAPYNIRVNAVAPGSILTDVLKSVVSNKEAMEKVLSRTPMLRAGQPIEIGNVVKFFASEDASYITGQILYVDGGRMALNYTVPVPEEVLSSLE